MRLSKVLNRQHIGFMFRKHWQVQGKRVPIETGCEEHLQSMGIPVVDAKEFIEEKEKREKFQIDVVGVFEKKIPRDQNHPDWQAQPCYILKTENVLLEGLKQAQVLTKSVYLERLPERVEQLALEDTPEEVHERIQKAILSACVFDCEQKKLPKIKDTERPAYNFTRILGITEKRKNEILTNRILQLIELSTSKNTSKDRQFVQDVDSVLTFKKEGDLLQFQEKSSVLIASSKRLQHDSSDVDAEREEVPDLHPVSHTVTIPVDNFYQAHTVYPLNTIHAPHTTWTQLERARSTNVYATPVTLQQVRGRSLTHCFTVAAAYAKQIYGDNVTDLPEPVWLNCVHVDGRHFHLGSLRLNTLQLDGASGVRNVWYSRPPMPLYKSCSMVDGLPTLTGYNPQVFNYLTALFKIQ